MSIADTTSVARRNSRTKNTLLSLFAGVGGQLLYELLRFITRTVFIMTLGKLYLGINGLFVDILSVLSLTELGFGSAVIFRLYKPLAENDDKQVRLLLKFYKQVYWAVGVVITLAGLALLPLLPYLIKDYASLQQLDFNIELFYLLFLANTVSSYFFFAYRTSILTADQRQYIITTTKIIFVILNCIAQITILFVWHNFILYIVSGIVCGILNNIVNAIISHRLYPAYFIKEEDNLPKEEIKSMFKDCGALFLYKLNSIFIKSAGSLIMSTFIGLAVVGIYSNYMVLYAAVTGLLIHIYTSVKGSMGNLFATATMEKKYFFFEVMNFITMLIYGTCAITYFVVVDEFIDVWIGSEYVIKQPLSLAIGVQIISLGLVLNLGQIRHIQGLFRQMWFRPVTSFIVGLIVTLILVQFIGVCAIPLGIVIARFSVNLTADPVIIHKHGFNNCKPVSDYYKRNLLYLGVIMFIGALQYFVCRNVLCGYGWWSVVAHALMCFITSMTLFCLIFYRTEVVRFLWSKGLKLILRRGKKA